MSNPSLLSHRLGKFKIAVSRIRDEDHDLFLIMQDVIVVKAEMKFADDYIYYTAISPKFEVLERGSRPVWYHPTIVDGEAIWVKE